MGYGWDKRAPVRGRYIKEAYPLKKFMIFLLALILLALPVLASAQNAASGDPADDQAWAVRDEDGAQTGLADEGAPVDDQLTHEAAFALAQSASRLYELIARGFALDVGMTGFYGAPDENTAWALVYEALEQGALSGMDETGAVTQAGVTGAYDALFAYGEIPAQPEDFTLFGRDGDLYRQTSDPGDAIFETSLLDVTVSDGEIRAEVAAMVKGPDTPADLSSLFAAILLPDEASPFGVRLAGLEILTGAPAMTGAKASATLDDYKGITYAADNVLDGDMTTAWAYSEEKTPGAVITLTADQPQIARGIRLTPAYAKTGRVAMTNNRIRSIRVELSDGAAFDFTVEHDLPEALFDSMASFAFDAPHEITWASVRVTGVYAGEKYNDTCISEIALF